MNAIIAWLVSFMVLVAPVTSPQFTPEAKETPEEMQARYESIASDIATFLWNPNHPERALFSGDDGRGKTASVMMGIMQFESGFRKDVDYGLGHRGVGDGGRSFCLMQIQTGTNRTYAWNTVQNRFAYSNDPPDQVVQGWTGPELVQDRKKCIEAGWRIMKTSFAACRALPVSEWLRMYASGSCDEGSPQSRTRMNAGINWFNRNKPEFSDAAVLLSLSAPPPSRDDTNILAIEP